MNFIYLDDIELPEDLAWTDEHLPWAVGQTVKPSLTGAQIIQEAALQAGRPITLQSTVNGNTYVAVVTRTTLLALRAKAAIAGGDNMVLSVPQFEGDPLTYTVRWNHANNAAIEASPFKFIVPPSPDDLYAITLRFIEV
ncbi:hypothetical protein [Arenimonas oryziterrae]|uniref:Uncharacterized protein n=1 Tax=Arenimonas oryziterrae DSM 21050 = YC6267 TaxID=1121015 RepID=A0A091ATL0_9GAMM|nr:hypothetical protein [Arenimonas oryziterrae]KFN42344.1 hypothetical protein N789_14235 [Arenimonas oryziterrae DSM 21050 = YC6267]